MNMQFSLPAEFSPHSATIMMWCERPGSWIYGGKHAKPVFVQVIKTICRGEKVYLVASEKGSEEARLYLHEEMGEGKVEIVHISVDDCWARDTSPIFLSDGKTVKGVDFAFNAWGGGYNGLYSDYMQDDAFASRFLQYVGLETISARPFVLEGGSVACDGEGTLITTEECLLSKGRNPSKSKAQIEEILKTTLRVSNVVWLPYGVEGDETDGHVDNICAFYAPKKVLFGYTEVGEQGRRCKENLRVLNEAKIGVTLVPFPKNPVRFTKYETEGFVYEEGEIERQVGEKLAASYVNFYVCNSAVIVPQFGDENDQTAFEIIKKSFPGKETVPVPARQLLLGGGNVHCLTMQIPYYQKEGSL